MTNHIVPEIIKPQRGGFTRATRTTSEMELRQWADEGLTGIQIAERLGYSTPSNVYKALSVLGIVLHPARVIRN